LKTCFTYFLVFAFGTLVSFAQNLPEKGVPLLQNFTPVQYQNRGKVWDINTAENGILYMAADKGLLEYDGKIWNSFKGSKGFTRSLFIVNDSLIYTGSDLDFGVWKKNKYHDFEYSSLYPFQKDVTEVYEEFWNVHYFEGDVFFVSFQNIYVYKNEQLTKITAPYKFTGSFSVDGKLYFADEKYGLFMLESYALKQVFEYPDDVVFEIEGIYHHNENIVIVTKDNGLYAYLSGELSPLKNGLSENLKIAKVFSFEQINDSYLSFGTVLKGLYVSDLNGKIIHHINKHKGLPNSTILSLHYSPSGKLWLGMDYGVSSLDLTNNITYFYDYGGDFGTGYTALIKDDIFYLGTNQGLYRSRWIDLNNDAEISRFQLVPGSEGQVWTLENIDDNLFIGHDRGLFVLKDNTIREMNTHDGIWTILPYNNFLLTGNYNGISIFKKDNNNWSFLKKMDLIYGSCNQLIIENDNILWVNIPNFGVIRAILDENLYPNERFIFSEDTFEGNNPYLTKNEEGIKVNTDKFRYTFNAAENKFIRSTEITNQSQVEGLLSGIYQYNPLLPDYKFYSIYNGFALEFLKNDEKTIAGNHALILRKIEAFNNHEKILYYQDAVLPYRLNNLKIEYIVPNKDDVLYQYKLNDADDWSSLVSDNTFEFLDLKHGEHKLFVRAFINGEFIDANPVSFRIAAPWYRSWYAYLVYFILFLLLIYSFVYWQKISLKKQRKILLIKEQNSLRVQAEKYRQEILLLEQERIKMEFNQIKEQLKVKTIELANKAKDNEDKNRLLLILKDKCNLVQKEPSTSKIRWHEMHRLLDSYINVEDKTFEIQMDALHQEFFRKLKEYFPGLSSNDLRLCAYLKIGLNSKEIADILNIQPSSSYISRSRLRKKLNLRTEEDLYDFLNSF
jgi:AraC family transcriptional regulator, chitin signaling transcriptional activator